MNNTKELLELCEKHPDLPIVPLVDGEVCWGDNGWYAGVFGRAEVGEVASFNDRFFDDREDFKEYFFNCNITDIGEAFGVDDNAVEEYLNKIADEHFRKAIIVYIGTLDREAKYQ